MMLLEYLKTILGATSCGLAVFSAVILLTPVWDRLAEKICGDRVETCIRLGYDALWLRLGLRTWGIAFAANIVFIGCVIRMPPIAAALAWLLYVAPKYILNYMIRTRKTVLRDQMVSAGSAMANAVKAGLSLANGLGTVAENGPKPIANEFRRIVWRFNKGEPLRQAMEHVRQRLRLDAFSLFVTAVQVTIDRGSPLNVALERICYSLQEHQRLERQLVSETAAGMRVVLMLAALPPLFLAGMYFLTSEGVMLLFTSLVGQCVVSAAILIEYLGLRMAAKILKIDV